MSLSIDRLVKWSTRNDTEIIVRLFYSKEIRDDFF